MCDDDFSKVEELLAERQKWSSLTVTMDEIASEHKALVRDLSSYDPRIAVPLIASLSTVPEYQSNCLRLELLAVLAWRHCKGRKKAQIGQAVRWFREIGKSQAVLGEDPAEDVFASLVIGSDVDYRILEGLWESSGFYSQIVYDVVQTMPSDGHWATIKRRVEAILTISEIVCQRAGISRYQTGNENPQMCLSSRHLPGRNELVRRVNIPFEVLEERGVKYDDIVPFLVDPVLNGKLGQQQATQTELHFRPLAVLDQETVTVVLPTCLSLAMREYVIGEVISNDLEDAFDSILAERFSTLLYDTPLLGGPRHAPVSWRKVNGHRVSSFGFKFDEGYSISVHFFLPSIRTHREGGFDGAVEIDGSLVAVIQNDMLASIEHIEKESNLHAGMTLLVVGGWGKGCVSQPFNVDRENWHFTSLSIADLVRISWDSHMKPAYFWRILEGLSAVESKGVHFVNPNGILNLIGWVRDNEGHFVPHAKLPSNPITPDYPLNLCLPLNMLRGVRAEADNRYDKHSSSDESGKRHIVQRPSSDPFFESEGSRKLYASMTDVRDGMLTSYYEGAVQLWLSIDVPDGLDRSVEYRLWEMANEWLHRIGIVIDRKLVDKIGGVPLRTNLVFLDIALPEGAKAKPTRAELEKLYHVEVSYEKHCATVTFDVGFLDGFRVAENIAERVVVKAMLSGFIELILGELPDGVLDEFEKAVVPNDDARSFHFFQSQGFMDYVRQLLPDKLVSVNEIDDGIVKLGLAWRVRDPADEAKVIGREECTSFLNSVVDCLIGDIKLELETLPRRAFLNLLVKNIEKAHAEEDHWRRTSAAILGLHGRSEETLRRYVEQSSSYAAAGIASRVLAEMSVCICPIEGTVQPAALSLSRLISRTLLVIRLGGLSDAIRFNALQPELTLSSLGDILFKDDFGEMVVEPLLERVIGDRFVQMAPKQKINYEEPEVVPEAKGAIDSKFWNIWTAEMGFDIDQARNIIGKLEDIAVKKRMPTLELKRSEVIQKTVGDSVSREAVEAFLKQFCLTPRPSWDQVPKGFDVKDIYPWRFGRRLSFVVRPIIQVDEAEDPLLLVAPHSLFKGFVYLFDGAHSGSLDQSFFHTTAMRNDWWGSASEGHQFAASVADELVAKGWQVQGNVPLTKILNRKFDIDYGDVDVLAWREDRPEVLIVECKNLQSARNYSEIAAMLSEYQGKSNGGKRDKLKRHLDRVGLLSKNKTGLGSYIKKTDFEVVSCLCCNGVVPMQYSKVEALQATRVGSVEELIGTGIR